MIVCKCLVTSSKGATSWLQVTYLVLVAVMVGVGGGGGGGGGGCVGDGWCW